MTDNQNYFDAPSASRRWCAALPDHASNIYRLIWFRTRREAVTECIKRYGHARGAIIGKHLPNGCWH